MAGKRKWCVISCDFETTVYEGQDFTEVWLAGWVPLHSEECHIQHSIEDFFTSIFKQPGNLRLYFHNLKFDGSFILYHLLKNTKLKPACVHLGDEVKEIEWLEDRDMPDQTYKYSISDKGAWYSITIKDKRRFIEIRDSLKLMPVSLARLGKSFHVKHQKLNMEYKGFRYAGCSVKSEELKYFEHDLLCLKECLEHMYHEGHERLTIGSCCLAEFKGSFTKDEWNAIFPNLNELENPYNPTQTIDRYIRNGYKGGWCYFVPGKSRRILRHGLTADVNSLYPYVMHSASGNRYPIGLPTFWRGNFIPEEALDEHKVFFVRLRCRFNLKEGFLPTIQIKRDFRYKGNEWLTTSDLLNEDGIYTKYEDYGYGPVMIRPELTLTYRDYELLKRHYDLEAMEILDGCYFSAVSGLFDEYIDKYKEQKISSTGAAREIAKFFSNNLYGKMASSPDSSFKVAYIKDSGELGFEIKEEYEKTPGYIPTGALITANARYYTITHAQANYHGPIMPGFCYADTDSIHCDLYPSELVGIHVDPYEYGAWKLESCWDEAIFVRQKTYIERVTHENLKPVTPYHNIKCAGMPQACKDLLTISLDGYKPFIGDGYTRDQVDFIKKKRSYTDFNEEMAPIPGKLLPKQIPGGVLLTETVYKMRGGILL